MTAGNWCHIGSCDQENALPSKTRNQTDPYRGFPLEVWKDRGSLYSKLSEPLGWYPWKLEETKVTGSLIAGCGDGPG